MDVLLRVVKHPPISPRGAALKARIQAAKEQFFEGWECDTGEFRRAYFSLFLWKVELRKPFGGAHRVDFGFYGAAAFFIGEATALKVKDGQQVPGLTIK